eukprot:5316517-Prymnesium_polylepis.1
MHATGRPTHDHQPGAGGDKPFPCPSDRAAAVAPRAAQPGWPPVAPAARLSPRRAYTRLAGRAYTAPSAERCPLAAACLYSPCRQSVYSAIS